MNTIASATAERIKQAHDRVKEIEEAVNLLGRDEKNFTLRLMYFNIQKLHINAKTCDIHKLVCNQLSIAKAELEAANKQAAAELLGTA